MIIKFSIFAFFILFILHAESKNAAEYRLEITDMMLHDNVSGWQNLIGDLERKKQDAELFDLLLSAQYGLMGYLMANEDYGRVRKVIDDFEQNLNLISEENDATIMAYYAAIDGFRIALKASKAITLSAISNKKIENALKLEPENTTALFVSANILFFSPAKFGGNQQQALAVYEKSFEILKNKGGKDWIYYGVGAWLVRVYYHFDMIKESRKMCELMLKDAPEFKLIKEELYPVIKQSDFDKKWDAFLKEAGED